MLPYGNDQCLHRRYYTRRTPRYQTYYVTMDTYIADAKIGFTNATLPDVAPLLGKRGSPAALIATKLTELAALEDLI